jgi:hypothetical protein
MRLVLMFVSSGVHIYKMQYLIMNETGRKSDPTTDGDSSGHPCHQRHLLAVIAVGEYTISATLAGCFLSYMSDVYPGSETLGCNRALPCSDMVAEPEDLTCC